LSGTGLDVIEIEKLIKEVKQPLLYEPKNLEVLVNLEQNHILLSKNNVVFISHIAFSAKKPWKDYLKQL
jgi:lactate dehydrogenase-like 2-hydroxyacid dehydrogenase